MKNAVLSIIIFFGIEKANAYELGLTSRKLLVSNNGKYYARVNNINYNPNMKYGFYFKPDYEISPYFEWVNLQEEISILPIIGIRYIPKIKNLWMLPGIGLNVFPLSIEVEANLNIYNCNIGIYHERLNWGDQGWYSYGVKVGYNINEMIK